MGEKIKTLVGIVLISFVPTLFIWLPFFFRIPTFWNIPLPQDGMATVVSNYDGPLYIVVAKTLYNSALIQHFEFGLPVIYYAAHFPLFPLLIKLFGSVIGFPYGMLTVTALSSIAALYFFKLFIAEYVDKKDIWWMVFVFALFPARWLIVRSVGASEPLFLAAIIASVYNFKKEKFWAAGIAGAIAILTKSPGILLFLALTCAFFLPRLQKVAPLPMSKWPREIKPLLFVPILLIPIALIGLFYFYKLQFNDFLAYFHSGDNIHLFFPPFQIFNYAAPWVGTFWLEEVLFVYLFGALGLAKLIRMKDSTAAWFVGIFFVSILFVSHRDIIRYALPIVPFLYAAFADTLTKKDFKYVMLLLIIPIYLFSVVYISQNTMPISDWTPLL